MKKKASTIILVVLLLAGLSLLLYPTVANTWNAKYQSRAAASYADTVNHLEEAKLTQLLNQAQAFNSNLARKGSGLSELSADEQAEYESTLTVDSTGVISYINIPSINVTLPVYHGTSEDVLRAGVGHVEGSSLPVGGESTHCVLSGHRGLPSSKLFTNLDQLTEGDIFILSTLNETLTYEVDQILIVEPSDVSSLGIVPGEDLCTLVTCTPYGVNTHRLLVRGHRIENLSDNELLVSSDALQLDPMVVAPFAAVPIFLVMLIWILKRGKKKR